MGNKQSFKKKSYELIKNKEKFNFKIIKGKDIIEIKSNNYSEYINESKLSKITGINFKSINEVYQYIIKAFEKHKISIKNIKYYFSMILILEESKKKKFEIILYYKKRFFFLRRDTIVSDSYTGEVLDNTFTTFKSIDNIWYLIYSTGTSIKCYDLIQFLIIFRISNAHNKNITNFRYCFDNNNRRDLVMSISSDDNDIKIWNAENWKCIAHINRFNSKGKLYSSCFLIENNEIYILTSNFIDTYYDDYCEPIKVFNLNGQKLKEINESNEITFFIDIYYDKKNSKKYILTGNKEYVKSYDYDNNKLFNKYNNNNNYEIHSVIINDNEEIIKLINSGKGGYVKIWNFHTAILLDVIDTGFSEALGLCLYNNTKLIIGCNTCNIIFIEMNKSSNNIAGHRNRTITIKKIIHPNYGECLITQGNDYNIQFWK